MIHETCTLYCTLHIISAVYYYFLFCDIIYILVCQPLLGGVDLMSVGRSLLSQGAKVIGLQQTIM